MELKINTSGF